MMLIVCILVTRLHAAGYDDLPRMMLARSSWSLATRRTRRLHGAKMSVIGMSQIPNASISIVALSVSRALNICGFGFLHRTAIWIVFSPGLLAYISFIGRPSHALRAIGYLVISTLVQCLTFGIS